MSISKIVRVNCSFLSQKVCLFNKQRCVCFLTQMGQQLLKVVKSTIISPMIEKSKPKYCATCTVPRILISCAARALNRKITVKSKQELLVEVESEGEYCVLTH